MSQQKVGTSRESRKKGEEQLEPSAVLFKSNPEVEVKVCHGSRSSITQSGYLMTAEVVDNLERETAHQMTLFPEPAIETGSIREWSGEGFDHVRFPWINKREPVDFQTSKSLPQQNHVCC